MGALTLLGALTVAQISMHNPPPSGYGSPLAPMTADVTYYADPVNGSDASPCTSGAPCQTIGHVQTLIPLVLDYNVTIILAAGTYNEYLTFLNLDRGTGLSKSITVQGSTWNAYTVATGANSGTFTSVSGIVATMSSATWTAHDLRGSFVNITSGSLSGKYFPIDDNTATGITLPLSAANMTSIATATFAIVRPAALITHSEVGSYPALVTVRGTAAVNFTAVDINSSSAVFTGINYTSHTSNNISTILQSRIHGKSSGGYAVQSLNNINPIGITATYVDGANAYDALNANYLNLTNSAVVVSGAGTVGVACYQALSLSYSIIDGAVNAVVLYPYNGNVIFANLSFLYIYNSTTAVQVGASGFVPVLGTLQTSGGSWTASGVGLYVYGNSHLTARVYDTTISAGTDGIRTASENGVFVLAGAAGISAVGVGVNLAYSSSGSAAFDDGARNNVRVASTASIAGTSTDIGLGDTNITLAALRALAGKVLVGTTTLNRAISY